MLHHHTVLDSVALTYQPVWNRRRQLAAVRLNVLTVHHESVDAQHLMQNLGGDWPAAAPLLILSFTSAALLEQALNTEPVHHTWIEVPGAWFTTPEGMARLAVAIRRGHQLLRHAPLADVRREVIAPLDVRSLLCPSAEEALEALRSRPVDGASPVVRRSPIVPGQLYEGVCSHALATHCLDEAEAWGLAGWPEDDVLHTWRHQPMACDASVIAQIRQAIDRDSSLDQIERFVRQDPVLAYRLLLLVNSAAYGLKHEIDSLRHAIMMLGFTALGAWLSTQLPGSDTDAALHPIRYAQVMRARLAQHLLDPSSEENLRAEVYLAALFAQLDRLEQKPLGDLLNKLPLSGRIYDALLRQDGPYHPLLDIARAQGEFDRPHQLPAICEQHDMGLEVVNRGLIRMLATSRDHGGAPEPAHRA